MSAIRALRQLASTSRVVARPIGRSSVGFVGAASAARQMRQTVAARAFSVSARTLQGSSDTLLSQKLAEELKYEAETAAKVSEPEFLRAFNQQGEWTIDDVKGNDEVTMVRKFGNENIRLMFSIADIQAADEDPEFEQEDTEEGEEHSPPHTYPIRASFSITKENVQGCINIDTMCQEGSFIIDTISFYPSSTLGTELTADADWKRRGLYIGPQFDSLDVSVQEEFERFLSERGVNEGLATFVPEYAEWKEQKEYMTWLKNVKTFVDARS